MARLRVLLGILGFALAILAGSAASLVVRDPRRLRRLCARWIAALASAPLGLRVRYSGLEHLRAHRPCVVVVNHQSIMEIPLLARVYPADSVVVARTVVGKLPLVGRLFRTTQNILIERGSGPAAIASLNAGGRAAGLRGEAIWMFPEGTRNPEPGTILPLKRGAFHLARTLDAPIVPVVVSPLWPAVRGQRGRRVEIVVLEPVPASEADPAELAERVRERMRRVLQEM